MRIAFIVNPVFDGWSPTDARLGGTEESVVKWAEELANRSHKVCVYLNRSDSCPDEYNRVRYHDRSNLARHDSPFFDAVVNVKSPDILPVPGETTWYFTNEVDVARHDLTGFAGIIWPSEWAQDHYPTNHYRTAVVPHGYDDAKIFPDIKIRKQVLYASSPDRGLDELLRVWPAVYEEHPDAILIVTYGAEETQSLPGVIFMGDVDEDTMSELYRTSDVWCYPCNGGELYCMTAVKAQAAACVPVYYPTMALKETVRSGVTCTPETLAENLIMTLKDDVLKSVIRKDLAEIQWPNWKRSTDQLLRVITS